MSQSFIRSEEHLLKRLGSRPERIQNYLDALRYRREDGAFSPLSALREERAHCFDGALLAAAALRRGGYKIFLVDLCAVKDDDHVLCGFIKDGRIGAVAKSNFPGLRFREPIFKSVRELAISYFEFYFNLKGEKTLREFAGPVRLPNPARMNWECDDAGAEEILPLLVKAKHIPILGSHQARTLRAVDQRLFRSQMIGVDRKGAYGGA